MGRNWDEKEDQILIQLVKENGKQWGLIASKFENRSASQVAARWEKCLDPNLTKGPFTPEEDRLIREFVAVHGAQNWPRITQFVPARSAKQCRERWFNHLDPNVSKHSWTAEEDQTILENYQKLGGKWAVISKLIPGRTDNAIKNRWNSSISKRIKTDANGVQILLPDPSKRQHRQSKKERPPPIVIPSESIMDFKPSNLLADIQAPLLFTPLNIPTTPNFQTFGGDHLFSPISPLPGFQTTSGGFPGFNSPSNPAPATPTLFSPSKPGFDVNLFK